METYKSCLNINKYLLSSIGLWPEQTKIGNFMKNLIWISLFSFFSAQVAALVKYRRDMDMIIQTLPPLFANSISIACFGAFAINQDVIALLLSKMEKHWIRWTENSEEIEMIRKNATIGKKLIVIFIVVAYGVSFEYIFMPLVPVFLDIIKPLNESRPKRLMIVAYYYVNSNDYYFWISLHATYSCVAFVTVLLSIYGMFIAFIYHACGQLAILGFKLKTLVQMNHDPLNDDEEILQEIKFCVKLHKSIIIFMNDVKKCFSTPYFFAMGLNMLMMSFTMIQMIINIHDPREVIACLFYTFGQMFMLLCLTLPCQRLIDLSLQIPIDIHNGFWYKTSLRSQKMLLIIIMRTSNPLTFTAGKLYTFSMENYGAVVKTSFSYLTVLTSVRE